MNLKYNLICIKKKCLGYQTFLQSIGKIKKIKKKFKKKKKNLIKKCSIT